MRNTIKELVSDLKKAEQLPKDDKKLNKLKCQLSNGTRVYWYYKEDLKFYEDEGESIKDYRDALFSGIFILKPYVSGTREANYWECVIVIDHYPTEGEDIEIDWLALNRLLDHPSLVEIYSEENND